MADNLFNPSEDAAMAEEAAQEAANPFTGSGSVALPGAPTWEQYKIGGELGPHNLQASHVPGLPDQILPGNDGSQDMSAMGGQVGLQRDLDSLYTSNASPDFSIMDQEHSSGPDNQQGFDSMQGLSLPKPVVMQPEQAEMYQYPPQTPFDTVYSDAHAAVPSEQQDEPYNE